MNKKKRTNKNRKAIERNKLFFVILGALMIISILAIFMSSLPMANKEYTDKQYVEGSQQIITGKEEIADLPKISINKINVDSKLEDFSGRPSLIVFAGTYCVHCRNLIPELEKEIWSRYRLEANIWINVMDGASGTRFDVNEIPQGYNQNLDYEAIIGDCSYVPAYVVLDKNGKQILRSCGAEKTIDEIKQAINSQLK